MHIARRHFLRQSAVFLAGSSAISGWSGALAATATKTRSLTIGLTADEQAVLAWVGGYASSYRLQGGCVLGKTKGSPNLFTQIVAFMPDRLKFAAAIAQKSPLNGALVNGDAYTFQFGQTVFTLTNASTGLPTVASPDWMHQAIQYDPTTHTLTDPLNDTGTLAQIDYTIKLVTKSRTVPQNFTTLVTGLFESSLYELKQDATFNTFRNSVLNTKVTAATIAASVNTIFLQNLAALAQVFPAYSLGPIIQSPLLASSLPMQFKLSAAQIVARFAAVRPKVSSSYSDEAVWLAILLPAQTSPQKGDLVGILGVPANAGFNVILSQDGLAAAQALLNDKAFLAA
jgi:hypothetical protein